LHNRDRAWMNEYILNYGIHGDTERRPKSAVGISRPLECFVKRFLKFLQDSNHASSESCALLRCKPLLQQSNQIALSKNETHTPTCSANRSIDFITSIISFSVLWGALHFDLSGHLRKWTNSNEPIALLICRSGFATSNPTFFIASAAIGIPKVGNL